MACTKLQIFITLLVPLLLISIACARPADLDAINQLEPDSPVDLTDGGLQLAHLEENPNLYLIIAEASNVADESETETEAEAETNEAVGEVEKRSAELDQADDLETAAGTNVLRPLFVYRQQLAYRERVKKGVRRVGIRPRF